MLVQLRRSVSVAALAVAVAALPSADARACVDSGVPVIGPREPFDAGPGCTSLPNSCGVYEAYCPPDAGRHDAGPSTCSEFRDTAPDGVPQRYACTIDQDCPGNFEPGMVCGAAGYCECRVAMEAPAPSCSATHARGSVLGALVIAALASWRRRGARGRART